MTTQTTLERLEQQVTWLPMRDQLRLIARIYNKLGAIRKPAFHHPLNNKGDDTIWLIRI